MSVQLGPEYALGNEKQFSAQIEQKRTSEYVAQDVMENHLSSNQFLLARSIR